MTPRNFGVVIAPALLTFLLALGLGEVSHLEQAHEPLDIKQGARKWLSSFGQR